MRKAEHDGQSRMEGMWSRRRQSATRRACDEAMSNDHNERRREERTSRQNSTYEWFVLHAARVQLGHLIPMVETV
jgi:hypothetical protein